jgi:dimethyladenosine transferase 2, mitochondrial
MYRSTTMLFQIMFEHEFIGKIPREYFLPWQVSPDLRSRNKLAKVKSVDPNFMYLIKVVPRKELYDLCQAEHMQGLWYFVKQHAVSRKNRVIPTLE